MRPDPAIMRFFTALLVVCVVAIPLAARRLNAMRPQATLQEVLYIRSAKAVRYLSLGYTGLAASIYWTRAVQYFGTKHIERDRRYELLEPLLTLATDLDPQLTVAYEFGSVFLSQPPPEGAGRPEAAVALVERGIQRNPHRWRLYYYLGFVHYSERKDYAAAAEAFERGSRVPGAHPFLRTIAAAARQKGGEYETARLLWTSIYETTEDKLIKKTALMRLAALRVDADIAHIESLIQRYYEQFRGYPTRWNQLIAAGYLQGIPADPLGQPYKLMEGGRIEVTDPDSLPFITKGLPPGRDPDYVPPPKDEP